MANVIGQLLVELGVNTAHLKEGFDKATYMSREFSKQVKESFSELGSAVKEFANEFSGLGGAAGATLQPLLNVLSPLTASLGTAGGAAAGLAVAIPAVGVAALGLAVRFSETAARLQDLSEATGIGVEQLSLLGNVAQTHGISVDQMAKAMERMARSALQAAKAGPQATSVYKDLGVAVTNTDGTMRDSADIFNDVSAKLAAMPDGAVKTADAIKLFGRAGAELIPLLNEGSKKLAEMEGHFTALNAVVSGSTAKASEELKENMTLMGAAFTGVENELTKDLVPALNEVAKEFISAFEGGQDNIKAIVDAIADIAKAVINVAQVIGLLLKVIVDVVGAGIEAFQQLGIVIKTIAGAMLNAVKGDWKGAWAGVQEAASGTWSRIKDNALLVVNDVKNSIVDMGKVWSASLPSAAKPKEKQPEVNPAPDTRFIDNAVAGLQRQAQKEMELADATGIATQAQIAATAAANADTEIQKLRDEAVNKNIQNTGAFRAALAAAIPKIQEAALWQETFKTAIADNTKLDALTQKLKEQTAALGEAGSKADAFAKEQNKLASQLVPENDALEQLALQLGEMQVAFGENDPRVKALTKDFDEQRAKVDALTAAQKKYLESWSQNKADVEINKISEATKALQTETGLLLQLDPYAKMHADIQKYIDDNHIAGKAVDDVKAKLMEQIAAQQKLAAASAAGATLKGLGVDPEQIAMLEKEKAALDAMWKAGTIGAGVYAQAILKVNAEIDAMNAKQGGFLAGAKAGFSTWAASLQTSGQFMQKEITTALDGITNNFAQMVATGKASWASLEQSMEEQMLKFAASTVLKDALKSISGALSGQGGFLGAIGGALGGVGGAGQAAAQTANTAAVTANTVGVGANTAALIANTTALSTSAATSGGGGGGIFSALFSGLSSGGNHATGGSVMPGKYYTVGENGPETLIPGASGTIIPNGGAGGGQITVVQNIQTPSPDSFRSSMPQLHAQAMQQASSAAARMKR